MLLNVLGWQGVVRGWCIRAVQGSTEAFCSFVGSSLQRHKVNKRLLESTDDALKLQEPLLWSQPLT